jgi:phage-related holin
MNKHIPEVGGSLIAAIIAAAMDSWQIIVAVFVLYAIALFGNLITGLLYAKQTGTYSQKKGEQAVYKKSGMITGIVILILVDVMIMGMARSSGITYNIPFFACLLTGYAAMHELTSMLGNIKKLGNKVPAIIDAAAQKAEAVLDQGKLPDLAGMLKPVERKEN